jgi:hypothetical protein
VQVTLVAYYGKKPPAIEALIRSLQEELSRELGSAFAHYEIEQVHATIIGLEALRQESDILNQNFYELRGERRPMNLAAVVNFIDTTKRLPFNVQIGGFSRAVAYPFTSRAEHPYFRSFSLQGELAVAMGWPFSGDTYPRTLDTLRKCFNDCNVLHKYHRIDNDIDNDFFFVLGRIERNLVTECQIQHAQDPMRKKLAAIAPVRFPVGREVLSLAVYEDPLLPLDSTENISLDKARAELTRIVRSYSIGST